MYCLSGSTKVAISDDRYVPPRSPPDSLLMPIGAPLATQDIYSVSQQATATLFNGLAVYNSLEIVILVFMTFSRYRGTYFYSLLIGSIGIVPYGIGNMVHFDGRDSITWSARLREVSDLWMANKNHRFSLRVFGWWAMVAGQSAVLWSRLHLIVSGKRGDKILRWTKWMIIINTTALLITTTVLAYGLNAGLPGFKSGYPP